MSSHSSREKWTDCLAPESIEEICRELDLTWRERMLTPMLTTQLFLLQVLHGNTAITHLPHLAQMRFSPGAFCKARMRLPLALFELLLSRIASCLQHEDYGQLLWYGHRVFLADGTGISMSDQPALVEEFGYPPTQRKGIAFPSAKLVFMIHLGTGMISKMLINPFRSHDITRITELHPELRSGDIFVADRAFCSYHHFCLLVARSAHAVIRMHHRLIADFRPGRKHCQPGKTPMYRGQPKSRQIKLFGKTDQIIEWFRPATKQKNLSKEEYLQMPESIVVREIQYQITEPGFRSKTIVVITTLIDEEKYTAEKIAALYGLRWEIETAFNHLKTTMGMDILNCKTPDGIKKELCAYAMVYNLVRLVILQAAKQQRVPPKKISFVDALRWLAAASPGQALCPLIIIPTRHRRFQPRTRKRRPKAGYPYMLLPRTELRKKRLNPTTNAQSK